MIKISFNKPAYKTFFEGDTVRGLQVKLGEVDGRETVMFKPVEDVSGRDVIAVEERMRNNYRAEIEGSLAERIGKALENPTGNPFFLLSRGSGGWMIPAPYAPKKGNAFDAEPPRSYPHMRVWNMIEEGKRVPPKVMAEMRDMNVPQFVAEIRTAKQMVDEYDAKQIQGRPPKEVTEAREKIRLLAALSYEVLPFGKIRRAITDLEGFFGEDSEVSGEVLNLPAALAGDYQPQAGVSSFMRQPAKSEPKKGASPRRVAVASAEPVVAAARQTAPKVRKGMTQSKATKVAEPEAETAAKALGLPLEEPAQPVRRLQRNTPAWKRGGRR